MNSLYGGGGAIAGSGDLHHTSNASMTKTISSPSRSLSTHTNTLPTNIGRTNNIHYQTESNNYSLKPKPKTFTSPRVNHTMNASDLAEHESDADKALTSVTRNTSFFHALNSMSATAAPTNAHYTNHLTGGVGGGGGATTNGPMSNATANITNSIGTYAASNGIYGTLPKATNSLGERTMSAMSSSVYGNVSAVASEFEQLIARNAAAAVSGASAAGGGGGGGAAASVGPNYNTLGSYRVQYSSTNPFLPSFNPQQSDGISMNSEHSRMNEH